MADLFLGNPGIQADQISSPTGAQSLDVKSRRIINVSDGLATGDGVNKGQLDAAKVRSNHSGSQTASTISDFSTASDARISLQKASPDGLATLDSSGFVPSNQLPSYVDDVLEAANFAALPATGATGKIYVTLDNNKTYRWSGSVYVEISESLVLGETGSTAYRGDRGKTAYDHSQLTSGNPHGVTKADVGLSNVNNTADSAKPVSTAQQAAITAAAAANYNLVNQVGHGFVAGNILYPNGTTWVKGTASDPITGLVVNVVDADNFVVASEGYVTISGFARTPGATSYAHQSTAGALTETEPSTSTDIWMPLFQADTATSGYFKPPIGIPLSLGSAPQPIDLDTMRKRPFMCSDFMANGTSQVDPFLAVTIASGAISAASTGDATPHHPGVIRLVSSTTANSGAFVGSNSTMLRLGGDEVYESVFSLITLANSTFRLGFVDMGGAANDAADGVYVEISSAGVVSGKTANNSTRSTTASTYSASAATWYRLRITLNAGATLATFQLYDDTGALLWTDTLSTNIPTTSGRETGVGAIAHNSGTTALGLLNLDFMAFTVSTDRTR